jgi:hypothetical protein
VGLRAWLPFWVRDYVNDVLDGTRGYHGHVDDVDLALLRGAYRIEGVRIEKETNVRAPLLATPLIDLSIEWRALLDGALVGEVHVLEPVMNFVDGPSPALDQTGTEVDWGDRLEKLFPFRINRLEVEGGTVHFRAPHRDPPVDVALHGLRLQAENWSNVRDGDSARPAHAQASGRLLRGAAEAALEADPLAARPDFALELKIENADLTQLNDFLRAYAGLDVQRGRLELYAEADAMNGGFVGYMKPLVYDLDVLDLESEADDQGLLASAWEALAGLFSEGVENQPRDQLATRIPISGRFDDPEADLGAALVGVFHNGFVEALRPRLDGAARPDAAQD